MPYKTFHETISDKFVIYPHKDFVNYALLALKNKNDFDINVKSKSTRFILRKAIDCWPRLLNDIDRVKAADQKYLTLSMLIFPKLWFVNMTAICSGYIMNYYFDESGILILYSHH